MMRLAALLLTFLALGAGPAAAQGVVTSDGVEHVRHVPLASDGFGGSLVGERLFVTGNSHLSIFDVGDPEAPALLGTRIVDTANESEAVATDGRVLALASPACSDPALAGAPCLAIYDVSDPTDVQRLASLELDAQNAACVMGCRYVWVSGADAIVDLADPARPRVIGSYLADAEDRVGGFCYTSREVRPGLVMTSCDPNLLLSILPEHGGRPDRPVLLAVARDEEPAQYFVGGAPHSAHWPRGGTDRFALTSLETPFRQECSEGIGSLTTWDARPVMALQPGSRFAPIARWRPENGTFADGRSPYNAVGCSPHWLAEHPTFRDGGLIAQAALDNGLRFLEITATGQIAERGWFLAAGGVAAVPIWHPDGRTLYLVDYTRGLDVLRYTGPTFVPAAAPAAPAPPSPPPAPRLRLAGAQAPRSGPPSLLVEVPSAGRLSARVTGRAGRFKGTIRAGRASAAQAGLVRLPLSLPKRARLELRRRGRVALDVRLDWRPSAGARETPRAKTVLRRTR